MMAWSTAWDDCFRVADNPEVGPATQYKRVYQMEGLILADPKIRLPSGSSF